MKKMAQVAFSGSFGNPHDLERDRKLDVAAAAEELQQAGYEVHRLPEKYGGLLAHPLDDFIEAVIEGPGDDMVIDDAVIDGVNAIVGQYGGLCFECGLVELDYVPFELFKEATP